MPNDFRIRDVRSSDLENVLAINNSEVPHVSEISMDDLRTLREQSCYFRVAEKDSKELMGFLLALDENAKYQSPNFLFFKAKYSHFVYIDRVALSKPFQGMGVGKRLYDDLLSEKNNSTPILSCEVNIRPPNPASMEFHRKLGFTEVATQETEAGKKTVSLLVKTLYH